MRSPRSAIFATLAVLGSGGVLPACGHNWPATEVAAAGPPATGARVPDGIEPLTAQQKAELDLVAPTDEELRLLLNAGAEDLPPLREGACASEGACGTCSAAVDSP